ncbi:uncharacterized protein LOC130051743 [Ostrea edulis]|uniref:uncharacterized protein LOC130051743 n=1 Tax=Ostrea edulis TaxID=37623 RepID=UPI0024AF4260|nr:uncharacterized protein LOC130051743 [Ostrea edulis]
MKNSVIIIIASVFVVGVSSFECEEDAYICETSLEITETLTMYHDTEKAVYPKNGFLYKYDITDTNLAAPVNISEVITADGWEDRKLVVVANGTLPGPSIIAYEDQVLVIRVTNSLPSDTVSIHWHGLEQRGTPYMDGTSYVTQCPIAPGQTFTYTFKVTQGGTYWYHSHAGVQRGKGLYGALVIRERNIPLHLQNVSGDFILQLQDWNHDYDVEKGLFYSKTGVYLDRREVMTSKAPEGLNISIWKAHSSLINGNGRYHDPETGKHNEAPLQIFDVDNGKIYRFRVINAASMYSYRVSIDNHSLTVVASDGYFIRPVVVESVFVHPGERYDFTIHATSKVQNYMIRGVADDIVNPIPAEAVLHYRGSDETFVNVPSRKVPCSSTEKCIVLNCPVQSFLMEPELQCMAIDTTTAYESSEIPAYFEGSFHEYFLNFVIPGPKKTPRTVNYIDFVLPSVSALSQPNKIPNHCSKTDCKENEICKCTNVIDLDHNDTIQFVFMNMGKRKGWDHPIHMHGHSFDVLKFGFANYNETTGEYISQNTDIDCKGNATEDKNFCNNATWRNPAWLNGNVPGLNLVDPPRKDTVIVPFGGYVVVRIKADNPGLWFLHCQMLPHTADGMAVLLNESFPYLPEIPKGFPICGDFEGIDPGSLMSTPEPTTTTPIPTTTEPARCLTPADCLRHTGTCGTAWECVDKLCHCRLS